MEFYLAGEIAQVIDSIPWVRCASGNVLNGGQVVLFLHGFKLIKVFPFIAGRVHPIFKFVGSFSSPKSLGPFSISEGVAPNVCLNQFCASPMK